MISAIVVNYHSAKLTEKAVSSVTNEDVESEIFVIDNTATPSEHDELRSLMPKAVKLMFNGSNIGFARACNRAYAAASGELILLLNPDAFFLKGSICKLAEFMAENEDAGAVGPRIFWDQEKTFLLPPSLFPSPAYELCRQAEKASETFGVIHSLSYRRRSFLAWTTPCPIRQTALSGGHVMVRRSAIERCGGLFDDGFFMYFEDSDLMLRLQKGGWRLFIEPRAEVVHRYIHENSKLRHMEESSRYYYRKNYGNSFVLKLAARISGLPVRRSASKCTFAGAFGTPLRVKVPEKHQERWLFEWSPSPDLVPSVGRFGSGPEFSFPEGLWSLIGPGTYYSRISTAKPVVMSASYMSWEKMEV
ncbi:MAG: glycosyltransferase family 2 protein [Candidatus Sulfobium sp.]|jgi:GT2 family glycosyltransferase